jgi:hypothetical protein
MPDLTRIPVAGVTEYLEGDRVELVRNDVTGGQLSIRAVNEGGNNATLVDLWELLDWMRLGPKHAQVEDGFYLPVVDNTESAASRRRQRGRQ